VDKQLWDNPSKRMDALLELKEIIHNPKGYKGSPLKRVWIPKENKNEMRPLAIPTLIDRAAQAVYQMGVDPVVEEQSDPNSYGFRVGRSPGDAITRIRTLLDKTTSPRWILDADVAKCFDTISHTFLMEKTPICDKIVVEQCG
jgi:RNA-directed DNA polymerase